MMESFHSSILGPVSREWPKGPKVVFGKDSSMGSMAYSDPFTEEAMEIKISYNCIFNPFSTGKFFVSDLALSQDNGSL